MEKIKKNAEKALKALEDMMVKTTPVDIAIDNLKKILNQIKKEKS